MSEKKVVVEYAEKWTSGGIESYVLNLVKRLDREKFIVRIVVAQKETDIYDEELAKYGTKVECILPDVYENPIARMIENRKLFVKYFSEHQCDVLHLHICQGVAMGYAKMAKKIGIPRVIAHCHNTEFGDGARTIKTLGHFCGKLVYEKYPDVLVACSDLAAKWLYTKNTVKNGKVVISKYIVEVEKFLFDEKKRKEYREKYGISEHTRVYLNVGRLHYQKNQIFLLDIFSEIFKVDDECILFIIGTGELKDKIYEYAAQLKILDRIIFIDKTREIPSYMSMADMFILPSLFEGNPVVGTEAQANGMVCFFSDAITRQAKVLDTVRFISLKGGKKEWAKYLLSSDPNSIEDRFSSNQLMIKSGYNVSSQIETIEKMYKG